MVLQGELSLARNSRLYLQSFALLRIIASWLVAYRTSFSIFLYEDFIFGHLDFLS